MFTFVRDAGRPQVVLLFFIASLLLLLTGCDVAEVGSSSGSNSSSSNLLGNHRYFTREARIEFSQGANRQAVRAQDNPYFVRQGLSRPEIDFEGARPLLLDGEAGHFLAYTPEKPENPTFSGVSGEFTPLGPYGGPFNSQTFSGGREIVWTFPGAQEDDVTLVNIGGKAIAVEGPSVTISITASLGWDGDTQAASPGSQSTTISVDGVPIDSLDGADFLTIGTFFSSSSGVHTVHETTTTFNAGVMERTWSYNQRGLVFTEEFPEYDTESPEPIEISNTVAWDDGAPLTDVEWTVVVGDDEQEKTGNTRLIEAVWEPVERILTQSTDPESVSPEERFEKLPLSVEARAPVFFDDDDGPVDYRIQHSTEVPGQRVLSIINADVNPDEPFANGDNYAEILADVIYFDPEIMPDDINWQVDIKNSAGEIVWENMANGNGTMIAAQWDGTLDGAPLPPEDNDPTTYIFGLSAFLCDDDGGVVVTGRALEGVNAQVVGDGSCTPDPRIARADVTVGAPLKLEIFPEGVAPPIADSEDNSSAPSDAARKRLGTVHKLENWQLQADLSGVPESERPTELFVQMESQISGVKPPLATLTGGKTTGIYTGQLTATHTDGLIKRERPATGASSAYLDAETTFSSGSMLKEDQTTTFFSMLSGLSAQSPKDAGSPNLVTFAKPRQGLGRLIPFDTPQIEEDEALLDFNNLSQFGFEAVTFTMSKADNPVLDMDISATLKVQNPASIVHTVTFGGTNAFLDLGLAGTDGNSNSGFFDPESLRPLEFLPKTWIIEGCNALDAYDYNNNRNDPADPVSGRISPGAQWHQETRKGDTILLGYAHPVSKELVDVVQEEFGRELDRLSGKVPPALLQQYAWLSTNVNVYKNRVENYRIRGSLAACAWDNENYYFIAYWPPYAGTAVGRYSDALDESKGKLTREIRGYYRIPVAELREFPSVTEGVSLPNEHQVRIPK